MCVFQAGVLGAIQHFLLVFVVNWTEIQEDSPDLHTAERLPCLHLQRSQNRRLAPHTPPATPPTPASKATPELLMLPKYQMSC